MSSRSAGGGARSLPIGGVVDGVRALVEAGYREVVLSGVDVTSYGPDLPGRPTLGGMIRRVLDQVPELDRLRLSSLDPAEIDDALWRLIADEPRLMPHLHLSLQSGCDLILKRMARRHSRAQALAVARRARSLRPDLALGCDVIAGFPTETEAMAAETETFLEEAGIVHAHVFPYSERPGTPAARMPPVPKPVRKERAARLRAIADRLLADHLAAKVGSVETLVAERRPAGSTGPETPARARDFSAARLDWAAEPGTLVAARVTGARDGALLATRP